MQRYDLVTNYRCGSAIEEMVRADDGEWVRYEDVGQLLAALNSLRNEVIAGFRIGEADSIGHTNARNILDKCQEASDAIVKAEARIPR